MHPYYFGVRAPWSSVFKCSKPAYFSFWKIGIFWVVDNNMIYKSAKSQSMYFMLCKIDKYVDLDRWTVGISKTWNLVKKNSSKKYNEICTEILHCSRALIYIHDIYPKKNKHTNIICDFFKNNRSHGARAPFGVSGVMDNSYE